MTGAEADMVARYGDAAELARERAAIVDTTPVCKRCGVPVVAGPVGLPRHETSNADCPWPVIDVIEVGVRYRSRVGAEL